MSALAGHTVPVAQALEKLYINMSGGPKHRLARLNVSHPKQRDPKTVLKAGHHM